MEQITSELIQKYKLHLLNEEKANATTEKYIRDIMAFLNWTGGKKVSKETVLSYKEYLIKTYAPASVNAALSSLNNFFSYNEWYHLRVKALKIQKQIFLENEKELTKTEYERLINAAKSKKNKRLFYLMQTICSTGIRVSELKFITVEAISKAQAQINCKGKMRVVIIPNKLCRILKEYARKSGIKSGSIFVTKTGKPIDRSNIWSDMKKLCKLANVAKEKVFPHNLRHLFARTFYSIQKDIVRLADVLGHSSVNTTRIYTMENCDVHRKQIQKLGLLMC
ncbi:MAG: integrase [Ruminococcaceae bacterium]|nr:integrase [Oscillospiraceae bacterium]